MKLKIYKSLLIKGILNILIVIAIIITNGNTQVLMTIGGTDAQNYNSLSEPGGSWIDNSTISNWYWQTIDFIPPAYVTDEGYLNPLLSTRIAYYKTGAARPEFAMGGIPVGGNGIAMGVQFQNISGAPIEEVSISYTGEQWHVGGVKITSKIFFWYKVSDQIITDLTPNDNSGWTPVSSLDFTSPVIFSFGFGNLNGNDPANRVVFTDISIPNLNIPSGSYIMFRWSYPDQGVGHGLAIDDVTIKWIGNTVFQSPTGSWSSSDNWNWGQPDNVTNAIIDGNATADVNGTCYNLVVNSTKSLTINSGITVSTNNNFYIKSSSAGTGSYINNGTLSIAGSPNVEMYVPGTTINNGIYFSPPLTNIQAPSVSDIVYRYNASTCTWVQVFGTLNIGTGYTIRSDNPVIKNLNGGSLYNSSLFIGGLVRQSSPNNYGWNLVGNPYVCGVDWEILNDNPSNYTNLTNGFYIRASDGSLVSWVNGVGSPSGTTSIIPPIHAFYAQVVQGQTSGNLQIPLNARTHNTHLFYKNLIPIIRLKLTSSDNYSDETVIRIDETASDKLDNAFDLTKMFASNDYLPQVYSLTTEKEELCINAVSVPENKIISVPLGFLTKTNGIHSITAFDFANIDNSYSIHLKDNLSNIMQDLRKNPVYYFSSPITSNNERFVIILNKNSSKINNSITGSKVNIHIVNKSIVINLNNETNASVEVYNVLGETVLVKQLNDNNLQKIDINVNNGVYFVKVITSKTSVTKKVLIN